MVAGAGTGSTMYNLFKSLRINSVSLYNPYVEASTNNDATLRVVPTSNSFYSPPARQVSAMASQAAPAVVKIKLADKANSAGYTNTNLSELPFHLSTANLNIGAILEISYSGIMMDGPENNTASTSVTSTTPGHLYTVSLDGSNFEPVGRNTITI